MKTINPITTRYYQKGVNGKKILEHRHIMQVFLNKTLNSNEHVHHINGIKTDNRIENLLVIDPVSHGRLHHLKYSINKECVICSSVFTPHKTKRKRQQTCSENCRQILSAKKRIKVSEIQFNQILTRRKNGEKLKNLAIEFNVTETTISEWCNHGCLAYKKSRQQQPELF